MCRLDTLCTLLLKWVSYFLGKNVVYGLAFCILLWPSFYFGRHFESDEESPFFGDVHRLISIRLLSSDSIIFALVTWKSGIGLSISRIGIVQLFLPLGVFRVCCFYCNQPSNLGAQCLFVLFSVEVAVPLGPPLATSLLLLKENSDFSFNEIVAIRISVTCLRTRKIDSSFVIYSLPLSFSSSTVFYLSPVLWIMKNKQRETPWAMFCLFAIEGGWGGGHVTPCDGDDEWNAKCLMKTNQ